MDKSYLDSLAEEVYIFIYDRVIHKRTRESKKEELRLAVSSLSEDEKAYVRECVIAAFDGLRKDNKKKK